MNQNNITTRSKPISFPAIARILSSISFGIGLAAFAITGSYMRLSGDDYCYGAVFRQLGFWKMQTHSYTIVTPYSGNRFALTLFSGIAHLFPVKINGLLPALTILIWLGGIFLVVIYLQRILGKKTLIVEVLLISAALLFLTLHEAPDIVQSLYWRSAMLPYTAPLAGATLLIAYMLKAYQRDTPGFLSLSGIGLLALINAGFSETGAALQAGFLGLLLIACWLLSRRSDTIQFKPTSQILLAALAGTTLGILLLVLSPTNQPRQIAMQLPPTPDLLTLIRISSFNAYIFCWGTIKSFPLHSAVTVSTGITLSLLYHSAPQARSVLHALRNTIIKGALTGLITFLLVACCVAPSAYAQSSYPVARALITPRYVLITALFICGWVSGSLLRTIWFDEHVSRRKILAISALCLTLLGLYPLYTGLTMTNKLQKYQRWAAFWDIRNKEIDHARQLGQFEIDVMQLDHIIPGVAELSADPQFWYNNCAEDYYDMQSISAGLPGWDD
jgi:hypothetical protein